VAVPGQPGPGPRLQDILVDGALDITMHEGFEFWLDDEPSDDPSVKASLERANSSIYPTLKLTSARAAYWCRVPHKAHLRWVLADEEEPVLAALARLSAGGQLTLGEGTKFAGMFRAHGLLVPVWDLPFEPEAEDWEAPLAEFAKRYAEALASTDDLTPAERRSRQGLLGRQLTLR
jgi:glycine/D-amino acid oxidase-like deaminating enzyme